MIITSQDIMDKDFGINIDVYDDDTNKRLGWVHLDIVENDTTKKLELVVASDSWSSEDQQTMKYIEDGFTTNTNIRGYFITRKGLKRIKAAAKIANLSWQAIASRPKSARELVERIENGISRLYLK